MICQKTCIYVDVQITVYQVKSTFLLSNLLAFSPTRFKTVIGDEYIYIFFYL